MARLHLRFRNFHPSTIAAADQFFAEKPWRMDPEAQISAAQTFADAVSDTYGVRRVQLNYNADLSRAEMAYTPALVEVGDSLTEETEIAPPTIHFGEFSILTFFYLLRVHVLSHDGAEATSEQDPSAWACSLFYKIKPVMFRARAREGRVLGVSAKDTYSSETWQRMIAAGVATDDYLLVEGNFDPRSLDGADDTPDEEEIDTLPEADGLDALNRDAIRALAAQAEIPGRGRMNKDELVAALRAAGVRA